MRRILILWHILIPIAIGMPLWLSAQNCGIEDTIAVPANRTVNYNFDIADVVNNDLASTTQGICGIELSFEHSFSENLEISLTSPSGQKIQLIGPNTPDPTAFTFLARWNITFVPCAATAQPDSGYVAKWNNGQPNNFINGGRYRGSYYPFVGCLEDFNTGPVNGTWKITIVNNPSIYTGRITHFRLRLCDERGFLCCNANAGSLAAYPDLQACQGDSALDLTLTPDYGASLKPDTSDYGYTYVISRSGVIIAYDSLANLKSYPPGDYTVCGLSYRRIDRDSFPINVPLDTLRRQLNANQLLYCGAMTTNCIGVTIGTPPPMAMIAQTICQGDTVLVGNQSFTNQGQYNITLKSLGGCDSLVQLTLTVVSPTTRTLNQTICPGDSIIIGSKVYKTAGTYTDTLANINGCDSIITLNLAIQNIPQSNVNVSICEGERYIIGKDTLSVPATYRVMLKSSLGCDSLVNVTLSVLRPRADITPSDSISCINPTVTLNSNNSTPAGQLTYAWTDLAGAPLGTNPTLSVTSPGSYVLIVSQTSNSSTCTAKDTIQVRGNATLPNVDAGSDATISCANSTAKLGGTNTSAGANFRYLWRALNGNIVGDSTKTLATADATGDYILLVTNTQNGCTARDTIKVTADFTAPIADAGVPDTITCSQAAVTLNGNGSSAGANFRYVWQNAMRDSIGNNIVQTVSQPGAYYLRVINTTNGCNSIDSVVVNAEVGVPMITPLRDTLIPCNEDTISITANVTPVNGNYRFTWTGPGIINGSDLLTIQLNQPGNYILSVVNLQNNCASTDTIIITKQDCDICIDIDVPDTLTCQRANVIINADFCSICNNCTTVWSTQNGNIVSGDSTLTPTVNAPGIYTLTMTNASGFSKTIDIDIFQNVNIPTALIQQPDTLDCQQTTVTLDGSSSSSGVNIRYTWRDTAGATIGSDAKQVINNPGNYILEITNIISGCVAMDTVQVSADTLRPIAEAGIDTSLSCNQTSVILNGNGSSSGATIRYNWTTAGGNITSGVNSLTPTVSAPGLYVLTVSNGFNNCIAIDSVRVTPDDNLPPVPIFGDEQLTCNTPIVTLVGSPGNFQHRWCELDANNSPINCIDNVMLIANRPGVYLYEVTDSSNGCRNATTVRVLDARNSLIANAGMGDTLGCSQSNIQLNGSVNPAGNYNYKWIALNGSPIQNDTTLTPTVTQADIYVLEITDSNNGCVAKDSVEILKNEETPTVFAGFDSTLTCVITTLQLQATALGNNLAYQWTTQNGNITSGSNSATPIINKSGIYLLTVTNQSNGCAARDTLEIRQDVKPPSAVIANVDSTNLTCIKNTATLDGSASTSQTGAILTYHWSALSGNLSGNTSVATVQTQTAGNYQLIVTDASNSCRDTALILVGSDLKNPEISIPTPESLTCTRNQVTLPATTAVGNVDLQWLSPAGQVLPVTNGVVTVTQAGVYRLLIRGRTNGCVDTTRATVAIDTMPPAINIVPPTVLSCNSTSTQLIANASGGNSFTYNWTTADGTILSGANSSTATAGSSGIYVVQVTDGSRGCTGRASITVEATEATIRQAFFTVTPPNCRRQGSGFIQIDSVSGGTAPYRYSLGEFPFDEYDYFQDIRTGEYPLRIQDVNGCEWITKVTVPKPDAIQVELLQDTLINYGDTTRLLALLDTSRLDSIIWIVNGDVTNHKDLQYIVSPPETTEYLIIVTATNGCTAQDLVTVAVREVTEVFVPNVFTPNGDGANDVFMIFAGDNVLEVKSFMIFDRWGNRILYDGPFQPNDPTHGWDGTFNGQAMDAGVYVFYAEVILKGGRSAIVKGDVTLLR